MGEDSAVSSGNKNVNELSKKLLDGWVLISDSCPNTACSVPLVRSKDGQVALVRVHVVRRDNE